MEALELARHCAEILLDKKCEDLLLLDVEQRTVIADCFLIATARNRRQLRACAEAVAAAAAGLRRKTRRVEGSGSDRWVLIDLGDVVVHLFDAESRAFYDLESLWADAPRLALPRPRAKSAG